MNPPSPVSASNPPPSVSPPSPHLYAGLLALALAAVGAVCAVGWARSLEREHIHAVAPELSQEKLQGTALQKQAFVDPYLLVLYGSSELVKEMPNKAANFFSDYPTGFRVFPVGKEGCTPLNVLHKVAAVGSSAHGRKAAFSVSPGWFWNEFFDSSFYEGNFSEMQAYETVFSTRLSAGLKHDIAERMLRHPKTLDGRPFLRFTVERLAGVGWSDRAITALLQPLGRLHCVMFRMQDHMEVALDITEREEQLHPSRPPRFRGLNWNELLKKAAKFASATAIQNKRNEIQRRGHAPASRDKVFIQTLGSAQEWIDLGLCLRTFRELGVRPLLLSVPIDDMRLAAYGISQPSREFYLGRLTELANRNNCILMDFREHSANDGFTVDFLDHLSDEGWLYYNKALDDYFHDRLPAR